MKRVREMLVLLLLAYCCTAYGDESSNSRAAPKADPKIAALMEQLVAFDPDVREAAAADLVELGEPAALPVAALLEHEEIPVRRIALHVLYELGYRAAPAADALAEALSDDDQRIRRFARYTLRALGRGARSALLTLWHHHEEARWTLEMELLKRSAPRFGGPDEMAVQTFLVLGGTLRAAGCLTTLPQDVDPVVDGHPVSHWVNR